LRFLLPLQRIPAALCSSGNASLRTILLQRFAPPASFSPRSCRLHAALAVFIAVALKLPIPDHLSLRDVLASPRGSFVHGFFKYCPSCSVTDPPPGFVAAWPNLMPSITARRSGNVHGIRSVLAALRSLHPAWRVLACSQATLPRAVEPRAARDVFDVRHRCPEPADKFCWPGPSCCSGFWAFAPPASRSDKLVQPRLG
jgi:hypothetical protein